MDKVNLEILKQNQIVTCCINALHAALLKLDTLTSKANYDLEKRIAALEGDVITMWDTMYKDADLEGAVPVVEEAPETLPPDNKREACALARRLNLDSHIRTVCKAMAHSNSSGINYYATWDELHISTTSGAGTNSACVRIADGNGMATIENTIYSADDYGKYINVFRYGPWVEKIIAKSKEIRAANDEADKVREADEAKKEAFSFSEVDI
ncbi:MAG: hypothetical protein GY743_23435 [Planctomycetaceae bacterium]|nr:hypothetical protein [Planctomycetaceae bacterium]